jgi:hypothetical protein
MRLCAFLGSFSVGLLSIAAAKAIGSVPAAWLIGFLVGLVAYALDNRFFGK